MQSAVPSPARMVTTEAGLSADARARTAIGPPAYAAYSLRSTAEGSPVYQATIFLLVSSAGLHPITEYWV